MPAQKLPETYTTFTFDVHNENIDAFRFCGSIILKKLETNEPIPAELVQEYIGYMTSRKEEENQQQYQLCEKAASATVKYFADIKQYQFVSKANGEEFDFGKCVGSALTYYLGSRWIHEKMLNTTDKNKCIQTIFVALAIYSRKWNKSKKELLISNYKKAVIAAFITHQLDIHVLRPDKSNKYKLNDLYKLAWDCLKHIVKKEQFQQYLEPFPS